MTTIELLDGLISDLNDYISDYRDDIRRTSSRLEKQDREIRIDELKKWKETLRIIREEQE
jgi:hypothetical protein